MVKQQKSLILSTDTGLHNIKFNSNLKLSDNFPHIKFYLV